MYLYNIAIDILETKDGPVMLESNDTAGGFMFDHEIEDCQKVAELVISRMSTLFCKNGSAI